MIRVLTFMKIETGKSMEVVHQLQEIAEVVEIDYITGEYDLAMVLETNTPQQLHQLFIQRIDKIASITASSSNLLLKRWVKSQKQTSEKHQAFDKTAKIDETPKINETTASDETNNR